MVSLKIGVVGSLACGKSSIIRRFISINKFIDEYRPTIQDEYHKSILLDSNSYSLEITDSSGSESYIELVDQLIEASDGVIVVYSITDNKSFTYAKHACTKISRVKEITALNPFPGTLIGNKQDLEKTERKVSKEEGKLLSEKWHYDFWETSAKLGDVEIIDFFQRLTTRMLQSQKNKNNHVISSNKCYCIII